MLFRQLQLFVLVVDLKSFSAAAEKAYISQSAVSQQIQALEKHFGSALLLRGKEPTLTPMGEALYHHAKLILEMVEDTNKDMRLFRKGNYPIHLGISLQYDGTSLSEAFAAFSSKHQDVLITIESANHNALREGLGNGKYNATFCDLRLQLSDYAMNLPILEAETYIEVQKSGSLAAFSSLTNDHLAHYSPILISSSGQRVSEAYFYRTYFGFSSSPFLFAKTVQEAEYLASTGRGYFIRDVFPGTPEVKEGNIRIPLYREGKAVKRPYYLFKMKKDENPYIDEFASLLKKDF